MSKPPLRLFSGTKGDIAWRGDAEEVIASRVSGLDLSEHPIRRKQLSKASRKAIRNRIENRTATREDYARYDWDRRLQRRRTAGVKRFWVAEKIRLARGERGTRNWSPEQRAAILSGGTPKHRGNTMQAHHSYSVTRFPHLADREEVIYPTTPFEHLRGWHGGSYGQSIPGKRIRPINEF